MHIGCTADAEALGLRLMHLLETLVTLLVAKTDKALKINTSHNPYMRADTLFKKNHLIYLHSVKCVLNRMTHLVLALKELMLTTKEIMSRKILWNKHSWTGTFIEVFYMQGTVYNFTINPHQKQRSTTESCKTQANWLF